MSLGLYVTLSGVDCLFGEGVVSVNCLFLYGVFCGVCYMCYMVYLWCVLYVLYGVLVVYAICVI